MRTLIPRDHWEHRLLDCLCGLAAALNRTGSEPRFSLPGFANCLPARSGRAALKTALQALGLPPGASVAVPLFCCPVVFDAIAAAGCVPRFVDIDPETFCVCREHLSQRHADFDAVIAVHMFGNACDMPAIQSAAKGKPVIEDCAQALGTKWHGKSVGSFGAFGAFSFRSAKYVSAGEGGALFSTQDNLLTRASDLISSMPAPSLEQEILHLATCYLKAILRSRPLYGLAGYALWQSRNAQHASDSPAAINCTRIFKADLAISRRRLVNLDFMVREQRQIADFYSRTLRLNPGMLCAEKSGAHYNRYLYPVTVPSRELRDGLAAALHRRSVDTMKYLDGVVELAARHYGYAGGCPVSEQLSKRVLTLPCYYALNEKQRTYIRDQVNAAWDELGGQNVAHPAAGVARKHALLQESEA